MPETTEATPTVVWWRESVEQFRIPPLHRIGWADATGTAHGRLEIPSRHLRLDQRAIHTALAAHLVPHPYPIEPTIAPASQVDESQLSPEIGLLLAGHRITESDLSSTFGLDVVAGITLELLGAGPRAHIVVDRWLSPPVRNAAVRAATQAITTFESGSPRDVFEHGWTRQPDDRWQLLLQQI